MYDTSGTDMVRLQEATSSEPKADKHKAFIMTLKASLQEAKARELGLQKEIESLKATLSKIDEKAFKPVGTLAEQAKPLVATAPRVCLCYEPLTVPEAAHNGGAHGAGGAAAAAPRNL